VECVGNYLVKLHQNKISPKSIPVGAELLQANRRTDTPIIALANALRKFIINSSFKIDYEVFIYL
jgi:hypothetical protein